ncbi:MAG: amidohydrolase family protein [Candidatus Latescibacterota bacterium]
MSDLLDGEAIRAWIEGAALHLIDIHTHSFADPIARRAIEAFEKSTGTQAHLSGTTSDLRRSMEKTGIVLSVIQPIATKPAQVRAINTWAGEISGDGLLPFATLYPGQSDWEAEVEEIRCAGFKGVKLHPDYQEFDPDDRALFPMYEKLQAEDLIVLIHAGDDMSFPPPGRATPKQVSSLVGHFPDLRIIVAHLGGFRMWDAVEEYLVGKDVYLDTCYTVGFLETKRITRIMERHGFERILFGTDSPWKDQKEEIDHIARLAIPDEAKCQILGGNAARLLDLRFPQEQIKSS